MCFCYKVFLPYSYECTQYIKPLSHYTALAQRSKFIQSTVRSPEFFFIFLKWNSTALSLHSHGVLAAIKALLRSSHCVLSRCYRVLDVDCLRSHGTSPAFMALLRRSHCDSVVHSLHNTPWQRRGSAVTTQ